MIGQINLQERIFNLIVNHAFPRFSILVGPRGSGKKTVAKEIVQDFLAVDGFGRHGIVCPDVKIDTIREIITQAYKTVSTVIYIIPDADNMSTAAKNALLKVTEEPPNNAYFIMTLEDEENTLETIRSRGTIFYMDRYTPDEIFNYYWQYAESNNIENPNDAEICREICETPGEVQKLCDMKPMEFYDYVKLVADNIAEVSLANAFKIPDKVALKEDSEGYNLRLFWKVFMKVLADGDGKSHDFLAIVVTSKYLQKLRIKGINRQMLMYNWIIDVRDTLMGA